MTRKCIKKFLSYMTSIMLVIAMVLSLAACGNGNKEQPNTAVTKTFYFVVVDGEGNETKFEIQTDKTTVGEALLEEGLIAGEEGAYGLYVKTVNGITADYDVDKTYWAFYINGEMAMTGVDATKIEDGATYSFEVAK